MTPPPRFVLLRQLVFPMSDNGPKLIYERLLPYLNRTPLLWNVTTKDSIEWRTPSRGDDYSFTKCITQAMHFGMQHLGLTRTQAKHTTLMLRWAFLKFARNDICMVDRLSRTETSDLMLMGRQVGRDGVG